MKKKITVIALVACLLTILVGTSLAYFMDTDEATNTFTVGSVEIEQIEVFDKDDAQLLPVVNSTPGTEGDNYIQKKVTVKNTGENDAYVQTFVAVPAALDDEGVLKLWDHNDNWKKELVMKNVSIKDEDDNPYTYNVYRYRYNSKLKKDEETKACLEYVYIDSAANLKVHRDKDDKITGAYLVNVNGEEITGFNVATEKLIVYVVSQAVQADGFEKADVALDTAFSNHPWI